MSPGLCCKNGLDGDGGVVKRECQIFRSWSQLSTQEVMVAWTRLGANGPQRYLGGCTDWGQPQLRLLWCSAQHRARLQGVAQELNGHQWFVTHFEANLIRVGFQARVIAGNHSAASFGTESSDLLSRPLWHLYGQSKQSLSQVKLSACKRKRKNRPPAIKPRLCYCLRLKSIKRRVSRRDMAPLQ